jgi:phosphoserine phosphatase
MPRAVTWSCMGPYRGGLPMGAWLGCPMTEILLIRHGDVPWLDPKRFRGRAELKLTDRGIAQAEATARRISASWQPQAIYASPLGRTLRHLESALAHAGVES